MKKITAVVFACLMATHASAAEDLEALDAQPMQADVVEPQVQAESSTQAVAQVAVAQPAQSSNQAIVQTDIEEQNSLSDASTKDITPKSLSDFFEEFADKYGIQYGEDNKGKVFFTGRATVALPATDPSFAKALNLAFDNAMLNMQAEFVRNAFGRQSTELRQTLFSDDSTNARDFEKLPAEGRFAQILDKAVKLTGAKLDSALQELGVDVNGLTEERKKVLFADSLVQKISENAFGSMQGLVPVQTSMTQVSDNHYEVGVIAVMSGKTKQIASDMRQKRASLITGKGRQLKDVLPEKNEGYISENGIRLIYNESGAPVIISYGQWSYQPDSDPYMNNRKMEVASDQATSRADAAVSAFINSAIQFKRSSESSAEVERSITETVKGNDISLSEQTAKNIIDITNKEMTSRSDMNLRGLRTLKRWSAKDANGVAYVGVVRFYSHENVENTNQMVAPTQNQGAKVQAAPAVQKSTQTMNRKSRVLNDMDDF